MKRSHFYRTILVFILLSSVNCSGLLNIPVESEKSTIGEITPMTRKLMSLPAPREKIVIGVYKFKDQTGQYKLQENGSSWSTAIPQGTTTILLKALEDTKWFRPIERENIGDLLNERQIIRSTRKEYKVQEDGKTNIDDQLPPLLYAGILLEGGIISYDSNVVTGGIGARYFGLGANTQYRQDRVTVYLRLVSSMTGEILKTVYTSKNILSTTASGGFFRYVDTDRLMEAEMGVAQNEPVSLAVTQAIEKSVYSLIIEGVKEGLWDPDENYNANFNAIIDGYDKEATVNYSREINNRFPQMYRSGISVFGLVNADKIRGDYANAATRFGGKLGIKYFFNEYVNAELNANIVNFENEEIFKRRYVNTEVNLEGFLLPKYKLSPYVYAGVGVMYSDATKSMFKYQFGGGIEYMVTPRLGFRINAQYDMGLSDDWDDFTNGKRKDQALRLGAGINYYLGKTINPKTQQP